MRADALFYWTTKNETNNKLLWVKSISPWVLSNTPFRDGGGGNVQKFLHIWQRWSSFSYEIEPLTISVAWFGIFTPWLLKVVNYPVMTHIHTYSVWLGKTTQTYCNFQHKPGPRLWFIHQLEIANCAKLKIRLMFYWRIINSYSGYLWLMWRNNMACVESLWYLSPLPRFSPLLQNRQNLNQ